MSQREIDWERNRQFNLLRECKLTAQQVREGSRLVSVKPAAMKALLTWIDNHAGARGTCWASVDTLAMETGLARNTCLRALAGLKQLGLIIEVPERRGRVTVYHRRICWANLVDFCPTRTDTPQTTPAVTTPDQPAAVPETSQIPVQTRPAPRPATSLQPSSLPPSRQGNWCLIPDLPEDALTDPQWVQALWEAACDRGLFPEAEAWQITFFGLCRGLVRWCQKNAPGYEKRGRTPPSPIGILHSVLNRGMNEVAGRVSDEDRAWAVKVIRELESIAC